MEKWNNPELNELGVENTKDTLCYCDNADASEAVGYKCGKPGHPHKPNPGDRPNGNPCPPTPCPPPDDEDSDDSVIPQS